MTLEDAQLKLIRAQTELAREELRKARSKSGSPWQTPVTIATFLSLIGGALVFIWSEIKAYNDNFRALNNLDAAARLNDRLTAQKTQLGVEILTLNANVEAAEAELSGLIAEFDTVSGVLEQSYLATRWFVAEAEYAGGHRYGGGTMPPPEDLEALWAALDRQPPGVIETARTLHQIADFSMLSGELTESVLAELTERLSDLPVPADVKVFRWAGPLGSFGVDRPLMVRCRDQAVVGFYDVKTGEHLDAEALPTGLIRP